MVILIDVDAQTFALATLDITNLWGVADRLAARRADIGMITSSPGVRTTRGSSVNGLAGWADWSFRSSRASRARSQQHHGLAEVWPAGRYPPEA